MAAIVASIASAASNLPVIYRVTGNGRLVRRLSLSTVLVVAAGVGTTACETLLHEFH